MMGEEGGTVLVVPCYNEEGRLDPAKFLEALETQRDLHLLFVDDGSRDATLQTLTELRSQAIDRITVVVSEENGGKAEAVRLGMSHALSQPLPATEKMVFLGYWDADLATPLECLPSFVQQLAAFPDRCLVMGSRVRLLGRTIRRSAHRHYVGRIFSTLASLSLALPVYDTQCGAKLFRVCEEVKEVFARPFSDPWIFDVEILARLRSIWGEETASRVVELPLPYWEDVHGSKVRAWHGMRAAAGLAAIWYRRIRDERP